MAVADPEQAVDHQAVWLCLRRGAYRKATRAERIGTLQILKYSHEQARRLLEVPVEVYNRANRWLLAAAHESETGGAFLPLHDALKAYADRHVEGVVRVGMLREGGMRRAEVQSQLGITDLEYETAWTWWRDAVAGHIPEA
jgi:hypothetical protein